MTFEEFKTNVEQWAEARGIYKHSTALAQALKAVSDAVGYMSHASATGYMGRALRDLSDLAAMHGATIDACCAAAWNEIKDRKGRMVPGGAFVKEGDA